jgi:hypothetical protein
MPAADPATVHSVYGTATQADDHVRQVANRIARVYPVLNPFIALMNKTTKISDGKANKLEFKYVGNYPDYVTVVGVVAADGTTLNVTPHAVVIASSTLIDPATGEQILVLSKNASTGELTLATRGLFGGGTPEALTGKQLLVSANVPEEGSTAVSTVGITPTFDFNWFEQTEFVYGYTDRSQAIMLYGEQPSEFQEAQALIEWKKRLERRMFFGRRDQAAVGTSGATTHPRYFQGGLDDFIETLGNNVFDANGAFTYGELNRFCGEMSPFWPDQTGWAFGSRSVMRIMSEFGLSSHQVDTTKVKSYGIDVTQFIGTGWRLNVVWAQTLEGNDTFASRLYMIHRDMIEHHIMRGMGDTINMGITSPKKDGDKTIRNQILGTRTLKPLTPHALGRIDNITS